MLCAKLFLNVLCTGHFIFKQHLNNPSFSSLVLMSENLNATDKSLEDMGAILL